MEQVFSVSTTGNEKVLYSFRGNILSATTDGANPSAGLLAVKGVLYGTTSMGWNGGMPGEGMPLSSGIDGS